MKQILILILFLVLLVGCKPNKDNVIESSPDSITTVVQDSLSNILRTTKAYYYEPLDDTIYVDFEYDFGAKPTPKDSLEKYFIVSSYDSFQKDEKFQEELIRWQKLEPNCYVETYGSGAVRKYYISLGKYKSQKEIVPVFQEYKAKYPEERINFHSIIQ